MKRLLYHILAILFATTALVSCSLDDVIGGEVQEGGKGLTVSGDSLYVVETKGGNITLNVDSKRAWTASSSQSWCKVTPAGGEKGTAIITIAVEENTSTDERNAQVVIQTDRAKRSITVTQKQKNSMTLTSNKIEVDNKGKTIKVEVKSNVDFTYEIETSAHGWIKTTGNTKAMKTSSLEFIVAENEELTKREGKIVFKSGDLTETVKVYQAGAEPTLILTENEYIVASEGEEIEIQVKSNVSYEMLMPREVDWVEEVSTKAISTYTHHILVKPNESYDMRKTEIIFVDDSGDLVESVIIKQVQKDALVVAEKMYTVEAEGGELSFTVSSNVDFEVKSSVEWIEYLPATKALVDSLLHFSIERNVEQTPREGIITITDGKLSQEITVIQLSDGASSSIVSVKHNNVNYIVPTINGNDIAGYVYWGDNSSKVSYRVGLEHQYSVQKNYVMRIEVWGAEEITFPDIVGISEIDLSKF